MITAPLLVFMVFNSLTASWMNSDLAVGLAVGSLLVIAVLLIVSIALDSKWYIRRRFQGFIVAKLAPLNPTLEELQEVIRNLRSDPDAAVVGKQFKADKLYEQIALSRENNLIDV